MKKDIGLKNVVEGREEAQHIDLPRKALRFACIQSAWWIFDLSTKEMHVENMKW